jgi:hypothetical protein
LEERTNGGPCLPARADDNTVLHFSRRGRVDGRRANFFCWADGAAEHISVTQDGLLNGLRHFSYGTRIRAASSAVHIRTFAAAQALHRTTPALLLRGAGTRLTSHASYLHLALIAISILTLQQSTWRCVKDILPFAALINKSIRKHETAAGWKSAWACTHTAAERRGDAGRFVAPRHCLRAALQRRVTPRHYPAALCQRNAVAAHAFKPPSYACKTFYRHVSLYLLLCQHIAWWRDDRWDMDSGVYGRDMQDVCGISYVSIISSISATARRSMAAI